MVNSPWNPGQRRLARGLRPGAGDSVVGPLIPSVVEIFPRAGFQPGGLVWRRWQSDSRSAQRPSPLTISRPIPSGSAIFIRSCYGSRSNILGCTSASCKRVARLRASVTRSAGSGSVVVFVVVPSTSCRMTTVVVSKETVPNVETSGMPVRREFVV
jgi:hypothetical protein